MMAWDCSTKMLKSLYAMYTTDAKNAKENERAALPCIPISIRYYTEAKRTAIIVGHQSHKGFTPL
jgi:hypothetical protein